jgi:hypothetical protein
MALKGRNVEPKLVHHSDRGVQYASNEYTDLLKANQIEISMSRKANPWDNAACESFMKTLKYEEVLRSEYRNLPEARASIREFLEKVYNEKRLHSSLDYVPPAEFEANLAACKDKDDEDAAARRLCLCVFGGIGKSIDPMGLDRSGNGDRAAPGLIIVPMSFRPAIPRRGALQHCPPPLHQPITTLR